MTIKDLARIQADLWDARSKWFNLGLQLGVAIEVLEVIKEKNLKNADDCLTELLAYWLRQAKSPTWNAIVSALRFKTVDLPQLADAIASNHECTRVDSTPSPTTVSTFDTKVDKKAFKCECVKAKKGEPFQKIEEFTSLGREQKEQLEQRLIVESENIILDFNILCNKFFDSLEDRQVPIRRLANYLKGLKPLRQISSLQSASVINKYEHDLDVILDYDAVRGVIEKHSSFFDYRPVEYMIELAGSEEDKRRIEEYKSKFEHYVRRRLYECPAKIGPDSSSGSTQFRVIIECDYETCRLVDLQLFKCRLSLILNIPSHTLQVSSVEEGSVSITFLVPDIVKEVIFPLSVEQEVALREAGIIRLSCGQYHFMKKDEVFCLICCSSTF